MAAGDGLSAIVEASDFRPDYIFMDIGLPRISGVEATRWIRALELEPRPFICALTGLGVDSVSHLPWHIALGAALKRGPYRSVNQLERTRLTVAGLATGQQS